MAKVLPNRILVSEFKYLKPIISTLFTSLQLNTPITFAPGLQQSDIVFLKLRESQTLFPPNIEIAPFLSSVLTVLMVSIVRIVLNKYLNR